MQEIDILALANRHMAGAENVYLAPHIPAKKEANARKVHASHIPPDDPILVLYDDTVFGSAKVGYLMTPRGLYWKNIMEKPCLVEWRYLDADAIVSDGKNVQLAGGQIHFTQALDVAARTVDLIVKILRLVPESEEETGTGRCGYCDAVVEPGARRCPNCSAIL